jgi:hypothetical protein
MRLMEMNQDRHDLAWAKLAGSLVLLALGQLASFELRLKTEHKIVDIAEQFEYTHF